MNQVIDVVSSTQCAAPEMTHALKLLGKGNMGKGIKLIYTNGVITGFFVGGAAVALAAGVVFHIVNKKQAAFYENVNDTSDEEVVIK